MGIPIGFRFCPSDTVLLSYYLLKRLKREPTQFQIPDVDVYNIEPWSLFNDINDSDDEDDDEDEATCSSKNLTYVFTTIKKKHGRETERISRTVTTPSSKNQVIGTWRDQKAHDIVDMVSKKIIGMKRMLSFIPAPSKQDHDDEDNEGTSNKRKRNHHLDGISYIMHEYSMAGSSSDVLCRIRRKIRKSRKMNNKKMKYSSSDDQPLHGSMMPYEDDHHQMMTNTSVLLNHNQSSIQQQPQQQDQDANYNQQVQECIPQMMMNTSVLDHDQNSMWQPQQPGQDANYNQQVQECMPQMMMNTSVLDHDQNSMWQPQQPDQDAGYNYQQIQECRTQMMTNTSVLLDHDQSSMWPQQQPEHDDLQDVLMNNFY